MKLSVIIPIYNVEQYIEKCLNSLEKQNFQESEFEVIIIDDESPDKSLIIARELTKNKANSTVFSQKNKGLGGARNTGLDMAKGEYVLFLDSDDFILPHTLHSIVEIAIENKLDILEFGAQGVTMQGKIIYTKSFSSHNKCYNGIEYYGKIKGMDSACNKLYKNDFLNENNLRFIEKIFIEDYEFNTRVFFVAQRVMAIPLIVSHFLQSANSITRNNQPQKKLKIINDIINVIKIIQIQKLNAFQKSHDYFNQRLSFLTVTLFYQLLKNKGTFREFQNLKKQLIQDNIFFVNYPVFDIKKNLFRIFFLKNFNLIRLIAQK
jgi:glycosyltransferase involved in cell wall biosynthesis